MIGIIGGSGVYEITEKADNIEKKMVKTDYGDDVEVSILDMAGKKVAFIPRHAQAIAFLHIKSTTRQILMH